MIEKIALMYGWFMIVFTAFAAAVYYFGLGPSFAVAYVLLVIFLIRENDKKWIEKMKSYL